MVAGRAEAGGTDVGVVPDAEDVAEGGQGGELTAAAVHAGDRRSRRGAEIDAADRRPVRVPPGYRAQDGLPQGLPADADVAAHVVRVMRFLVGGRADRAGQDEVAEPGGEPLDLRLDPAGHVDLGSGRHVTVGPQGRPAGRGAGRIGDARLDHEHVRVLRVLARGHFGLGRGDLLEGSAQVQGAGPAAVLVGPRHRAGQGEVHLADPGAVAEPAQRGAVPAGQLVAGQLHQHLG